MLVKSPLVFGRGKQKELRYDKTNPRPYAKSVARVARTPALQNDPVDPASRAYRTNVRRSFRQARRVGLLCQADPLVGALTTVTVSAAGGPPFAPLLAKGRISTR